MTRPSLSCSVMPGIDGILCHKPMGYNPDICKLHYTYSICDFTWLLLWKKSTRYITIHEINYWLMAITTSREHNLKQSLTQHHCNPLFHYEPNNKNNLENLPPILTKKCIFITTNTVYIWLHSHFQAPIKISKSCLCRWILLFCRSH